MAYGDQLVEVTRVCLRADHHDFEAWVDMENDSDRDDLYDAAGYIWAHVPAAELTIDLWPDVLYKSKFYRLVRQVLGIPERDEE